MRMRFIDCRKIILLIMTVVINHTAHASTGIFDTGEAQAIRERIRQYVNYKEENLLSQEYTYQQYDTSLVDLFPRKCGKNDVIYRRASFRKTPFKNQFLSLIQGTELANYIQAGYQIYRYRSTFPEVLRGDRQVFHLFNEPSPLLGYLGLSPEKKEQKRPLNATVNTYYPAPYADNKTFFSSLESALTNNVFWGKMTGLQFTTLTQLPGVNPGDILKTARLINNHRDQLVEMYRPESNIFSGINPFFRSVFALLYKSNAQPLSVSSLKEEQQNALMPTFLQGSDSFNLTKQEQLIQVFGMKPYTQGINVLLDGMSDNTRKQNSNYNIYFKLKTASGNIQYLWTGIYDGNIYFGFYPTEGLLLAYLIPADQKKIFMAKLAGMLSIFSSGVKVTEAGDALSPILTQTLTSTPSCFLRYSEDTDGEPDLFEIKYSNDGSFVLNRLDTTTQDPDKETLTTPEKSCFGKACSRLRKACGALFGHCLKSGNDSSSHEAQQKVKQTEHVATTDYFDVNREIINVVLNMSGNSSVNDSFFTRSFTANSESTQQEFIDCGKDKATVNTTSKENAFHELLKKLEKLKGGNQRHQYLKRQISAEFAREKTNPSSSDYSVLSAGLCWQSVAYCAFKSGAISAKQYKKLKTVTGNNYEELVSTDDNLVSDATSMLAVPQGSTLGFFDLSGKKPRLIHSMVSIGHGLAIGNRNSCIGMGSHYGWETLNLAGGLNWLSGQNSFNANPLHAKTKRPIFIYYRNL